MTRIFDIVLSYVAIIVLTPLLIPIMIGLKLTGEHHIFYRQVRVGRGGKQFGLLKFATMLQDSPNLPGGLFTLKDDPRILPMGKFLRKTKINELPQLVNILFGEMSVIGHRPVVMKEYIHWPKKARRALKDSRPGLSGIGSIVFRNEEEILQEVEDKEQFYNTVITPYKTDLECWYQKNRSIALYWKLIWLTVDAVFGGQAWKTSLKGLPPVPKELEDMI